MSAQVFYDNPAEASVVVPVTFTNSAGVVADPSSITCVVTDPVGNAVSYTYGGSGPNNLIQRTSAGNYTLTLTGLILAGLYVGTWVGTGTMVNQVTPTTFRIVPLSAVGTGMMYWYTGKEELKSRLNITDNNSDYEIQLAIQAVTNWINTYCGRHFYQLTESRTYQPDNIWELPVDDIVSTPAVAAQCQVNLDMDGDGIFETSWGGPGAAGRQRQQLHPQTGHAGRLPGQLQRQRGRRAPALHPAPGVPGRPRRQPCQRRLAALCLALHPPQPGAGHHHLGLEHDPAERPAGIAPALHGRVQVQGRALGDCRYCRDRTHASTIQPVGSRIPS